MSCSQDQGSELELGQHWGEPGLLQSPVENPRAARGLCMEWGGLGSWDPLEAALRVRSLL